MAPTIEFQDIKFPKSRIISKYGMLSILISDNGPQFAGKELKLFFKELKIEHMHALVKHAHVNGLSIATIEGKELSKIKTSTFMTEIGVTNEIIFHR